MRLQFMTWTEVEDHLKSNKGIIIPIGSTEQHGPIGLIGTDAICPEVIADLAAETTGALIPPRRVRISAASSRIGSAFQRSRR